MSESLYENALGSALRRERSVHRPLRRPLSDESVLWRELGFRVRLEVLSDPG